MLIPLSVLALYHKDSLILHSPFTKSNFWELKLNTLWLVWKYVLYSYLDACSTNKYFMQFYFNKIGIKDIKLIRQPSMQPFWSKFHDNKKCTADVHKTFFYFLTLMHQYLIISMIWEIVRRNTLLNWSSWKLWHQVSIFIFLHPSKSLCPLINLNRHKVYQA